MKKISKEQWLEALESGKYRQCRKTLVSDDGTGRSYCCLGVAVVLAEADFGDTSSYEAAGLIVGMQGEYASDYFVKGGQMSTNEAEIAMRLNDKQRWSFSEIAAFFRERWGIPRPTPAAD